MRGCPGDKQSQATRGALRLPPRGAACACRTPAACSEPLNHLKREKARRESAPQCIFRPENARRNASRSPHSVVRGVPWLRFRLAVAGLCSCWHSSRASRSRARPAAPVRITVPCWLLHGLRHVCGHPVVYEQLPFLHGLHLPRRFQRSQHGAVWLPTDGPKWRALQHHARQVLLQSRVPGPGQPRVGVWLHVGSGLRHASCHGCHNNPRCVFRAQRDTPPPRADTARFVQATTPPAPLTPQQRLHFAPTWLLPWAPTPAL